MIIYCIMNKINGKKYIGQTIRITYNYMAKLTFNKKKSRVQRFKDWLMSRISSN